MKKGIIPIFHAQNVGQSVNAIVEILITDKNFFNILRINSRLRFWKEYNFVC